MYKSEELKDAFDNANQRIKPKEKDLHERLIKEKLDELVRKNKLKEKK